MYAVIETGGKQYRVGVGQVVEVEKLPVAEGEQVTLDRVLMISPDSGDVAIGRPIVTGAKVVATAVQQGRSRKVVVFKYKPKTRYRRKRGHRQYHTILRIDQILSE